MTTLKMKVDGAWIPVGGTPETVWTGPDAPTNPEIDLWIDTDEPALGSYPLVPLKPFSTVGWTWTNQGPATIVENSKSVWMTVPSVAGDNWHCLTKTLPSGTPVITLGMVAHLYGVNTNGVTLVLLESATNKLIRVGSYGYATGQSFSGHRSTTTSFGTGFYDTGFMAHTPGLMFCQIRMTTTQYTVAYSNDGQNFIDITTENKNAYFTTAPDRIGVAAYNNIGKNTYASFVHWSET